MPHQRLRQIIPVIQKRLKLWPVLGLIGVRQSGKSTLLRELLAPKLELNYETLDSKTTRSLAENSPDSFCEPIPGRIKVIDEVQKVPDLFDAVKLHVDRSRRSGSYILSGSTEFSQFTGIREALTGRIGILELFPFNLSEISGKELGRYWLGRAKCSATVSQADFLRKLGKGGMPGFFHLRDESEYESAAQLWLETTCFRDLARVMKRDLDGDLALAILTEVALSERPMASEIARRLNKDARVISRYLEGFRSILVLKRINPHPSGTGKPEYFLVDSGLCKYLGGSEQQCLKTHVLIEALSTFENQGEQRPQVTYYRSSKASSVPFVFEWKNKRKLLAVQISNSEAPRKSEVAALLAFRRRVESLGPGPVGDQRFVILTPALESHLGRDFEIQPLRG